MKIRDNEADNLKRDTINVHIKYVLFMLITGLQNYVSNFPKTLFCYLTLIRSNIIISQQL